jgi:putative SbcD/Mre11-related phosphoesterase
MKAYEFIDKALYFKREKVLVIADIHIGFEEAVNKQGILIPRRQYEIIKKDMKKIFDKTGKVNEIVICGDLKHEFGEISSQEWDKVMDFLSFLGENTEKIMLIKGNHDKILQPIASKKGLEIVDFYLKDGNFFMHGDKMHDECLEKGVKRIVIGHGHAAVTLSEDVKKETYKCFLVGKWKGKELIVLPSFFPLREGVYMHMDDTQLGFDVNFDNFNVFVPVPDEDKVLDMGKIKAIEKMGV